MRFSEYLRAMVTLMLATAIGTTVIGTISLVREANVAMLATAAAWMVVSTAIGLWMGRPDGVIESIRTHLSRSRPEPVFPKIEPSAVLFARLWPLLLISLVSLVAAIWLPTVPAITGGYALIWAIAWRKQAGAVEAIEDRDSVHFWIVQTPAHRPIKIVRVPSF